MRRMMSLNSELIERTKGLLKSVSFMDYAFDVRESHGGVFMQGNYWEPDALKPEDGLVKQQTRKWLLSPEMTDSEIVSTAFKLCLTSMEHRAREWFKYQGMRIFGPHFDVDDLVSLCKDGKSDAGARNKMSTTTFPVDIMRGLG
jgi:hypothetical protein